MSGAVKSNVFGSSGTVAAAAGGLKWESVVTASTVTVESNRGYFINTTSNACTVTLPASPDVGDQVILLDYARTWDTNAITIDSNGNDFQNQDDTYTVDYDTEGQGINIVYSGSANGWIPNSDIANALTPVAPATQKAIFGFGYAGGYVSLTNLVNSSGVIAADTTGVGTARYLMAASGYGFDKAIFAYGVNDSGVLSLKNLVGNNGVVASDVAGVGTARGGLAAASYGDDKAVFAYGDPGSNTTTSLKNLVNNSGVVAADVTGVGTVRRFLAAASYGSSGQALFAYGRNDGSTALSMSNLVNNVGVIASDVGGVGTARYYLAAAGYGGDKAVFAYGNTGSVTSLKNLANNLGVIAADVSGVGTARDLLAAASYGGDKAVFAYGYAGGVLSTKNLVNNAGVIGTDVSGVGTARNYVIAAGYSLNA